MCLSQRMQSFRSLSASALRYCLTDSCRIQAKVICCCSSTGLRTASIASHTSAFARSREMWLCSDSDFHPSDEG